MKLKTDILIIGGGISGLTLAIKLAELTNNQKILIITKETLIDCNTFNAQGGIACVWDKTDAFEKHIQDTVIAGDGLCDENVVKKINYVLLKIQQKDLYMYLLFPFVELFFLLVLYRSNPL